MEMEKDIKRFEAAITNILNQYENQEEGIEAALTYVQNRAEEVSKKIDDKAKNILPYGTRIASYPSGAANFVAKKIRDLPLERRRHSWMSRLNGIKTPCSWAPSRTTYLKPRDFQEQASQYYLIPPFAGTITE
ncbi:MAG: hypothetical protein HN411_05480 [Waddliaceae bacterium]|nr:hypothetical protein [Waddliaceae bacterium]MBT3579597.1 hypothetical protein [Waddliaceae bacterium]MBT4444573.1 hypothetical protein [Waddliaceae bacterium]MBT6929200.1 hypothetical protein [Waddliaceae bacterium]MBT7263975.1 hypothetical protein [Waddliaceae bacterium]